MTKHRERHTVPSIQWLRAGAVAAGLGAAVVAGHGTAVADTDSGTTSAATATTPAKDGGLKPHSGKTKRAAKTPAKKTEAPDTAKPAAADTNDTAKQDDSDKPEHSRAADTTTAPDPVAAPHGWKHRNSESDDTGTPTAVTPTTGTPTAAVIQTRAVALSAASATVQTASLKSAGTPSTPKYPLLTAISQLLTELNRKYSWKSLQPNASPQTAAENTETGVITGNLNASDLAGHKLTYTVTNGPAEGTVAVNADGTFTYDPNQDWAHNGGGTDSFTVKIADNKGLFGAYSLRPHTTIEDVPITVSATNTPPGLTVTAVPETSPLGATGYNVSTTDADGDAVKYAVTALPQHGQLQIGTDTNYLYVPDETYAHSLGASGSANDSFTVVASDDHGGTDSVTVTPTISFENRLPVSTQDPTVSAPDPESGVVTIDPHYTDPDGDTLSYYVSTGSKGTVAETYTFGTGGEIEDFALVYSPTDAARAAAGAAGATAADKTDSFTLMVNDGYGFTDPVTVSVPVAGPPTYAVTSQIGIGGAPQGLALSPDGSRLYATNGETLTVIDTHTNTVVGDPIPVGFSAAGVAVDPSNGQIYVTDPKGDGLAVVGSGATAPWLRVATGDDPGAVAVSAPLGQVYVANEHDSTVSIISTSTYQVLNTVPVGLSFAIATTKGDAIAPAAYVATVGAGGTLSFIEPLYFQGGSLGGIYVGGMPTAVVLNDTGVGSGFLFVANAGANVPGGTPNEVQIYDKHAQPLATIPLSSGSFPIYSMALSPNGRRLYVACSDGTVTVVDTATLAVTDTITVGGSLSAITVGGDNSTLYLADEVSGKIDVMSVPSTKV